MAASEGGAKEIFSLVREAFAETVRLVASARLREAVLAPLADDADELALLAEIEGATSGRLVAEERGLGALAAAELVHGVPHARFINASFAYAKPREPMRFSPAERGAWYAALGVETCIAEVGHHLTRALADAGDFNAVVDYAEMHASMSGLFVDLRPLPDHVSLHPDPAIGYPAGNSIAAMARGAGHNGIIYPSVRHPGGTCIAALWPNVVQSVAQGAMHRLAWSGSPEFSVEAL
ncbi:MAG TPA: RES family NAD+ phosphorylase [Allosphingosinicella sp.]